MFSILFVMVVAYVVYLLWRAGLFYKLVVKTGKPPIGNVDIAYKFVRGPYSKCIPILREIKAIYPTLKCLRISYDDPEMVLEVNLRYAIGVILPEDGRKKKKKIEKLGFKRFALPGINAAVTTKFPFRYTSFDWLTVRRLDGRISKYLKENKLRLGPVLEISDGEMIFFMGPLEKHEEFYVPEMTRNRCKTSGQW